MTQEGVGIVNTVLKKIAVEVLVSVVVIATQALIAKYVRKA